VELLAALAILAVLVVLLIAVSRRYGRPRLYMRPFVALWIIAVLFAVLFVWLWSD
jgi:hypothetical protein